VLTSVVERLLALLALVAMGISLVSLFALIRGRVPAWLADAALPLAAAVAIVATGGSLYLSEVAGYIRHHMELAGAKHHVFTDTAVEAIAVLSRVGHAW
jgi:hypothetical protein